MTKEKYVALYRVSKIDYSNFKGLTEEQRREVEDNYVSQGLVAQRDTVMRCVESRGGEIIAEFKEIISGRRRKDDEKGIFKSVMDTCLRQKAHLVISTVDRLARNVTFALTVYDKLEQYDLKIIVADLPQLDKMGFMIYSMLAQYEWEKCSERQKAAARARREHGSRTGRPVGNPDFTTKAGRKRLGPKLVAAGQRSQARWEADIGRRQALGLITHLRDNGYRWENIADELNKHGYRTSTGNDYKFWDARRIWNRREGILKHATQVGQESFS